MILGYHVIFTAYGFWLPNDPRGSWSTMVRSWEIAKFGPATKTNVRHSVASVGHDRARRRQAKRALVRSPVRFNGRQALSIANGFATRVQRSGYLVHACSVMTDHAHLVLGRGRLMAETMVEQLKAAATLQLARDGIHPFQDVEYRNGRRPTPWARGQWTVFLNADADVERAIRYVEENPVKEGKRRQRWSFVTPYDPERRWRGGR